MCSTNIQTAIKIRPFIDREKSEKLEALWRVKENSIVQIDGLLGEPYCFDHIFDDTKSNKDVYHAVVKPLVMSCLEGINSTIFAYGQTSSGKTHTMLGNSHVPGIINFAVEDIFSHIRENTTKDFLLRCSYLEIYNEKINDLLDTNAKDVKIREDYNTQAVYAVVKEEVVRKPAELMNLLKKGMKTRKIGCTDMNERSSRSHTIFKLVIQSQNKDSEGSYTESTLNLVDLAGTERVGQMNMGRERQVEGVSINKSLTTLGLVIRRLSENESYINYRDSKLTRLLQHSLGGNSNTLIIATITLAASEETKSTLDFAQRAKYVKNRPIINEKVTDKDQLKQYENLCGDYKQQIEKLKRERMEQDQTINALEDKISNIKLFTAKSFEETVKPGRLPNRRHTLAHYKTHNKNVAITSIEELEENNDEEIGKFFSPVKSELWFGGTNTYDTETPLLDDSICSSAYNPIVSKEPDSPKTPSALRREKELLEESYVNLKTFTNLETQLQGKSNELEELRDLTERLREENIKLQEENLLRNDVYIKFIEEKDDIYKKLSLLRTILDVKPFEEQRRKSLDTIIEEDIDLFNEDLDLSIGSNQVEEKDNKKLNKEDIIIKLHEENQGLRNEIDAKNAIIDQLKSDILQDKSVKEAELEILNDKIKKFNYYKEEMHEKLSELQKEKEMLTDSDRRNEYLVLNEENCRLKAELQDSLDRISEEKKKLESLSEELAEKNREVDCSGLVRNNILGITDDVKILHEAKQENSCELYQEELENIRKRLDGMVVMIKQRDELNNSLCTSVTLKGLNEKNQVLTTFSTKPQIDELYLLLERRLKEIENLVKETNELRSKLTEFKEKSETYNDMTEENKQLLNKIRDLQEEKKQLCVKQTVQSGLSNIHNLECTCQVQKSEIIGLRDQSDENQITEITELKDKLRLKQEELDEMTNSCSDAISNYEINMKECKHLQEKLEEEKIQLAQINESLEQKIESHLKFIQTLEATSDRQNSEMNALKTQLNDTLLNYEINMKENKELQEKVYKLKEEKIELTRINESLEQKIESHLKTVQTLEATSDRQNSEINTLKTQLNDTLLNYEINMKECKELQEKIYKLEEEKIQLTQINGSLEQKIETHLKAIETLQATSDRQNSEIDALKTQLNDTLFNCEINVKENKELQEKVYKLEKEKIELARINESLEQKIESHLKTVQTLEATSDRQNSEINTLKTQLNDTLLNYEINMKECKELQEKIYKLEEEKIQLTQINGSLEQKIETHLKAIQTLEATSDRQNSEMNALKTQLNDTLLNYEINMKECKELQEKIYKLEKEKIELARINESLEQKIESHLKTVQTLEATSDRQNSEIDALKTQLNDTLLNCEINMKENKERQEKVYKLEKEKIELARINESLEQKIETHLKAIETLQATCDRQNSEIVALQTQLNLKETNQNEKDNNELVAEIKQKSEEIESINNDKNKLKALIQELESSLSDQKRQVKERCADYLNLKKKFYALEIDLLTCKKDLKKIKQELENEKQKSWSINAALQSSGIGYKHLSVDEQVTELVLQIKRLEEELLKARQEIESKTLQIAANEEEYKQHKVKLESVQPVASSLLEEKKVLLEKLFKCENTIVSLEQALQVHRIYIEKNESLNNQLRDFERRYANLETRYNMEMNNVESLTKKLQTAEQQITNLQAAINKKRLSDTQPDKNPVLRLSNEFRQLSPNDLRRIKRQSIHDQHRGLSPDLESAIEDDNLGCSSCLSLKATISSMNETNKLLTEKINELKKENQFFDKENEDMLGIIKDMEKRESELDEELQKYKSNEELESPLLENTNLVKKHEFNIAQLFGKERRSDHEQASVISHIVQKLDKETQATCDIQQKYMNLKNVALLRRREGNYLRAKLNLPPDCPVLPDDLQLLPKPDPS